jgi:hypothetical protein
MTRSTSWRAGPGAWGTRWLLLLALALGASAIAPLARAADAASLRAKHAELGDRLRDNPYQRQMVIDSTATDRDLRGDVYAVLDHPFAKLSQALKDPSQWCDILILPFNTKYCHADAREGPSTLHVRIGRKYDQPVERAFKLQFTHQNVAATPAYFESRLQAAEGPVGTRDYRITVSAIPLDGGRSFLHLSYAYGYGAAGKFAMQAYLSTAGADKVGFSTTGRDANGRPQYIGGVRGAIERNVMRYYLAIDAHLDSLSSPREQQAERRIQNWFTATERYARQLHEMDRETYVTMKRQEQERQQTASIE